MGVAALLWGPAADRYGRRITMYVASVLFLASTLVCIFAPSIGVLMAFRAIQGASVAAYSVGTQAVRESMHLPPWIEAWIGVRVLASLCGRQLYCFCKPFCVSDWINGCHFLFAVQVLADIFSPEERGKAMGLLSIPLLVSSC